ncbi:MAG: flagellar biosynthetic protein FliO [Puniceicoccales bacterium]|jgi:flagellar biogenesis protein FliO|nr:flagellar biosynthetic protein FliO [Puniceicoccales bacterium]
MRRFLWVAACAVFLCAVPFGYYRFHSEKSSLFPPLPDLANLPGELEGDGVAADLGSEPAPGSGRGERPLARSVEGICLSLAVLLLLWGAVSALRSRRYRLSSLGELGGQIRVVQTRRIGSRHCLAVVAYGPKKFLIGITPQHIEKIADLEREEQKNAFPERNPL